MLLRPQEQNQLPMSIDSISDDSAEGWRQIDQIILEKHYLEGSARSDRGNIRESMMSPQ